MNASTNSTPLSILTHDDLDGLLEGALVRQFSSEPASPVLMKDGRVRGSWGDDEGDSDDDRESGARSSIEGGIEAAAKILAAAGSRSAAEACRAVDDGRHAEQASSTGVDGGACSTDGVAVVEQRVAIASDPSAPQREQPPGWWHRASGADRCATDGVRGGGSVAVGARSDAMSEREQPTGWCHPPPGVERRAADGARGGGSIADMGDIENIAVVKQHVAAVSGAGPGASMPQHQKPRVESQDACGFAPPAFEGALSQPFPCQTGSQQVSMVLVAPVQCAPVPWAQQRAPAPIVAPPPGTWLPEKLSDRCTSRRASAEPGVGSPSAVAGASIQLIRPPRPAAPLRSRRHSITSLTVNGIPFEMSKAQLCTLLEESGFAARYDYLYMPCNQNNTNRGHAFVNFCAHRDAKDFFSAWHGARIVGAGTGAPVLSISVSVVQGFKASVQHWTVAKMLSLKDPDSRPFIAGMRLVGN